MANQLKHNAAARPVGLPVVESSVGPKYDTTWTSLSAVSSARVKTWLSDEVLTGTNRGSDRGAPEPRA